MVAIAEAKDSVLKGLAVSLLRLEKFWCVRGARIFTLGIMSDWVATTQFFQGLQELLSLNIATEKHKKLASIRKTKILFPSQASPPIRVENPFRVF